MIEILHYLKDPKLWDLWYLLNLLWVMQDLYHQPSFMGLLTLDPIGPTSNLITPQALIQP